MIFDPMASFSEMGWLIVTQPGNLKKALAIAGPKGPIQVIYQPQGGDMTTHWEHVGWICIKAQNLVFVCDEVDMICSAGSSNNASSPIWKDTTHAGRLPALEHIIQYGRHAHLAFVGIARAPQDVWRRLTGQCREMLVFRMNERLELDAVRSRLGSNTERLPQLGPYEYLDWQDDGSAKVCGGRL